MEDITSFFVLVGIHQHETAPGERVLRRNTNPTLQLRGKLRSTPVAAPLTFPLVETHHQGTAPGSHIPSPNHLCTNQVNWSLPYTEKTTLIQFVQLWLLHPEYSII